MNKPKFNLKSKSEKETLIIMVCRYRGERYVYSTGMKVPPKHWNDKTHRVRATQDYLDHVYINKGLDIVLAAAIKILQEHEATRSSLTQLAFKTKMNTLLNGVQAKSNERNVLEFIDTFIQERKASPKYARGSIEVYENVRKHLVRFAGGRRLHFDDLTLEFLKGFKNYLFGMRFMDNHINKVLGTLRTILNEATELGINTRNDYKSKKVSVSKTETDNVYLTLPELDKVASLDLHTKPGLDKVRDLFLIGAFTGLRYSDFSKLKRENIQVREGKQLFNIVTEKTEDRLWIPIHPKINSILEKYNYHLPTGISNQKTNDHLKVISQLAGLNDTVTKRAYRGGHVSEEAFKKWELVSSHSARRSFATNAYVAGVPIANIMRITGHKKTETFLKYIKFDNMESALIVSEHPFFAMAS